jgi:CBS domain-containing protein
MGQDISGENKGPEGIRAFSRALLRDLQALERMLDSGMIETGIRRIGLEQEMFFVNRGWRPAPVALDVLEEAEGPFTPELALFNFEANMEPMTLEGRCFWALEKRIDEVVTEARRAAAVFDSEVILTGILPTLTKSDMSLDNITPKPRYYALNDALSEMRGGEPQRLRIEGSDELLIQHDSVMLEACNTSCQVHLQVEPDEFAVLYNAAQLVAGPVLAACANSPILFGKLLWAETRIALFQQSVDTRSGRVHMRELSPRVRFGDHWVECSVTELFQEDLARFRVLLTREVDEDPIQVLRDGGVPALQALQLNNGTVYRWNRPCYGVGGGKPHLRIECRYIPSGPTVLDEVANAAFWSGAVLGVSEEYGDVAGKIEFEEAKSNFLTASRSGLRAGFRWLDGEIYSAKELIIDELLPLAQAGLASAGVDPSDIEEYLSVVRDRVETGNTGARWMRKSLAAMKNQGTRAERLVAVTAATVRNQKGRVPGHMWEPAGLPDAGGWRLNYMRVEQFMTTSLFTVHEDELVSMVAFLMDRKQIRHVLVEDDQHNLVGLVSYRSVLRLMADGFDANADDAPPVSLIMERDPVKVKPETPTLEAMDLMRHHKVSCLPVVSEKKLVGIVSERDFLAVAYELLTEQLTGDA